MRDWKKYPVQAMAGVNTLFNALTLHPLFKTLPLAELKLTLGGGMAIQEVVAQRWHALAGNPIIQAYGLTEASPAVCINPLIQESFNGSVGLPLPETEIKFVDEKGETVAVGELGELWVRGPQVMKGYWNQNEETADVLTSDGWLKTGDIGYQNESSYVYLVDRKKDMIIISGFNVYPTEIESVLVKHSSIKEVAVIGAIDEYGVEVVQACCVLHEGAVFDPAALDIFCRQSLTAYKTPKIYLQLREIPKSNVGKILKKDLKKNIKQYLLNP
jgi:long-chain acyl-CoA synthetase